MIHILFKFIYFVIDISLFLSLSFIIKNSCFLSLSITTAIFFENCKDERTFIDICFFKNERIFKNENFINIAKIFDNARGIQNDRVKIFL